MIILIISPGLVEVPPIRIIGGIPEMDYRIVPKFLHIIKL